MAAEPEQAEELEHCQEQGEASSRKGARWAGWSKSSEGYDPGSDEDPPGGWKWVTQKYVKDAKDADGKSVYGKWEDDLKKLKDRKWRDFSWISTRALLDSANDKVARNIHDIVNARRMRWIAAQRAAGVENECDDFVIDRRKDKRFLIIGDPGEADGSQYAVVGPMLAIDEDFDSDFMLVLSDVIYPAGNVNDYVNGFYEPYKRYRKPILALPGNHDWYDGLNGFMFHFCGAEALPDTGYRSSSYTFPERIAGWLWRRASRPERTKLREHRALRQERQDERWFPPQPAPYFAMDLGPIRLVAIDTGIGNTIDREQGEWLSRVSHAEPDRPKVLLTGKPIWVDSEYNPTPIEWGTDGPGPGGYDTVDCIVRDPANGYVAAIGGDTHNYQRYTVTIAAGDESEEGQQLPARQIEYIVCGGAGAYMSATHRIGKVTYEPSPEDDDGEQAPADDSDSEVPASKAAQAVVFGRAADVEEATRTAKKIEPPPTVKAFGEPQFRCYPVRGDSIAYYTRTFGTRLAFVSAFVTALCVIAAALLVLLPDHFDHLGRPSVWEVLVFSGAVTPLALAGLILGLFGLSRLAPLVYRTASFVLIAPAAVVGLVLLGATTLDGWDWIWKVALVTIATVVVPVALTVVGYYGIGSYKSLGRNLATALLVVGVALLNLLPEFDYDSGDEIVVVVVVALLAVAMLTVLIALLEKMLKPPPAVVASVARIPWVLVPLVAIGVAGALALILRPFWETQAVQISVIAVAAVLLLMTAFVWLLLISNRGIHAYRALWTGRIDPDAAVRYVENHYRTSETEPTRTAGIDEVDGRTEAACRFFLPPDADDSWISKQAYKLMEMVSEVGNADSPPMFKQFLTFAVTDDRSALAINCYGVTGWRAQDGESGEVPREDCVRIELEPAPGGLLSLIGIQ